MQQCFLFFFASFLSKKAHLKKKLKTTRNIALKPSFPVITFHFALKEKKHRVGWSWVRPTVSEIADFGSIFNAQFDRVKMKVGRFSEHQK